MIIEDAKTHQEKGVFMPYKLYSLFQDQIKEDKAARKRVGNFKEDIFEEKILNVLHGDIA